MPLGAALAGPAAQASPVTAAACSPSLARIALSPASVPGGAGSTVTATLSCATPRALSIALKGFTGVRVPTALHVAAGKTTGSASVATATTTKAKRGWIVATLGKVRHEALLTIGVTPRTCKSPVLAASTLPALAYVGDHPVLALKLSCTAAAAVKITLKTVVTPSGPNGASLPVPASVTIGKYYSAASVTLTPKAYQPGQYKATVSARLGSRTFTRAITVNPGLASFTNTEDSCSPNDVNLDVLFTGIIPAGGETVRLKSSNAAVTVPATYTFSAPSIGGGVGPQGVSVKAVSKTTKLIISATLGSRTLTVPVTLVPPWQAGDKVTLTQEFGPGPYYGPSGGYSLDVGLSNPAPAGDTPLTGTVSSSSGGVEIDTGSEILVVPGCESTGISFEVPYATTPVHATITVTIGGSKASTTVTVEPSLASVTLPATIVGGQSGTGTVTLAGPPDQAETVFLQSEDGILTTPQSVTIPKGDTSAQFTFTTAAVTSDSSASVEAWHAVSSNLADSAGSNTIDITPAP
jgi:hypothetical protein